MTKERKIAIELWKAMREKVSKGEITDGQDMSFAKRDWLEEHGIAWLHGCWFCHYFRKDIDEYEDCCGAEGLTHKTPNCPLNRFRPSICDGRCEQFGITCNERYPMEQRLAAVDNIIKALKGEYKE